MTGFVSQLNSLSSGKKLPKKQEYVFIFNMLTVFRGIPSFLEESRYLNQVQAVQKSFEEVLSILEKSFEIYEESRFPETNKLIQKVYGPVPRGPCFVEIKGLAFSHLPFYPRIYFFPGQRDLLVKARESYKKGALALFSEIEEKPQEEKKTGSLKPSFSLIKSLAAGVLGSESEPIRFVDILNYFDSNLLRDLLRKLDLNSAFFSIEKKPGLSEKKANQTFRSFLIDQSMEKFQQRLGFTFSNELLSFLKDVFQEEDFLRLEACYLTSRERAKGFYELDLPEESPKLLVSLQVLMFFQRLYKVEDRKCSELFLMIHSRKEPPSLERQLPTFGKRVEVELKLKEGFNLKEENPKFTQAWNTLNTLFAYLEEDLYSDGNTFLVFSSFLEMNGLEKWKVLIRCLTSWKMAPKLDLSVFAFYLTRFKENIKNIEQLEAPFSKALSSLEGKFTDSNAFALLLITCLELPEKFNYAFILITTFLFPVTQKLLSHAMEEEVEVLFRIEEREKNLAGSFARQLQLRFHLSPEQQFSLMVEFAFLFERGEFLILNRVASFLQEFQNFSPTLTPRIVYFLYRHHPLPPLSFYKFVEEQKKWREKKELSQFYVSTEPAVRLLQDFQGVVDEFVGMDLLIKSSVEEDDVAPFKKDMNQAFMQAFIPSFQPLLDACKSICVTDTEHHLRTHEGAILKLSKNSLRSVYFQWEHNLEKSLLVISFFEGEAVRTKQVGLKKESLKDEKLFIALANFVLSLEEIECLKGKFDGSLKSALKAFAFSEETKASLKNSVLTEDEKEDLWIFFRDAKIAYRLLYLRKASDHMISSFCSPLEEASLGNIYSSGLGPSLLPKSHRMSEPNLSCYLIEEVEAESLKKWQKLFRKPCQNSLLTNLKVTRNGVEQIIVPVFCEIKSIGDTKEEEKSTDSIYDDFETYRVTLSLENPSVRVSFSYSEEALANIATFQNLVKTQLLLLKSRWYFYLEKEINWDTYTKEKLGRLQSFFSLSEEQRASLEKIFCSPSQEKLSDFQRISEFLVEFIGYFPDLTPHVIYVLYKYSPQIPESFKRLTALQKAWAKDSGRLSSFLGSPETETKTLVGKVVLDLTESLPEGEERKLFIEEMGVVLFQGFLPSANFLLKALKIGSVTSENKVLMSTFSLDAYYGFIFQSLPSSMKKVFLNWEVIATRTLQLTMSVFDFEKGRVSSNSFPLNLSIPPPSSRQESAFFDSLFFLSQLTLCYAEDFSQEDFDGSFESALKCSQGFKDSLGDYLKDPNFPGREFWEFITGISVMYRKLYLSTDENFIDFTRSPQELASLGSIYPSKLGRFLIPDIDMIKDPSFLGFYQVDAEPNFIRDCQSLFKMRQQKRADFNLEFLVTEDGVQGKKVPVFYQVENIEDLTEKSSEEIEEGWNKEIALKLKIAKATFYVTLSCEHPLKKGRFVSLPFAYTPDILESQETFYKTLEIQLLLLKSKWYKNLLGKQEKIVQERKRLLSSCRKLFSSITSKTEIPVSLKSLYPRLGSIESSIFYEVELVPRKKEYTDQLKSQKDFQLSVCLSCDVAGKHQFAFHYYSPEIAREDPDKKILDEFEEILFSHLKELADKCFPQKPSEEKKEEF